MGVYFKYVHEGKTKPIHQYVKPLRVFKDRDKQLHEYIQAHDVINRDVIQKMSFNEPATALRNYTKRTGQTFIYVNYDTWEKGDVIAVTPVIRTGRPKKVKILTWNNRCKKCGSLITVKSVKFGKGFCRSCTNKK